MSSRQGVTLRRYSSREVTLELASGGQRPSVAAELGDDLEGIRERGCRLDAKPVDGAACLCQVRPSVSTSRTVSVKASPADGPPMSSVENPTSNGSSASRSCVAAWLIPALSRARTPNVIESLTTASDSSDADLMASIVTTSPERRPLSSATSVSNESIGAESSATMRSPGSRRPSTAPPSTTEVRQNRQARMPPGHRTARRASESPAHQPR